MRLNLYRRVSDDPGRRSPEWPISNAPRGALTIPSATWLVDPARSRIEFTTRHLGMRLSGSFSLFEGTIFTTQDQLHSRASATVTVASVRTGMEGRDKAIRSVKLFNTEKHPVATYRTMDIRPYGDGYEVDGPMTLAGESRLVTFVVRVDAATDAVLDLKAETLLSRADFGIRLNARPAFLDRAVADTVGLSMRIRATAATTEGYPSQ